MNIINMVGLSNRIAPTVLFMLTPSTDVIYIKPIYLIMDYTNKTGLTVT